MSVSEFTVPREHPPASQIWDWLAQIPDPEIPVISIVELGIVRDVAWRDQTLYITVTPTYSGCPAIGVIEAEIQSAIARHGVGQLVIETRLSPPWTTDWIGAPAREKLRNFGIAPPGANCPMASSSQLTAAEIACPRCGSEETRCISEFGSTPCKAQYQCMQCFEPFDYFKPHRAQIENSA